MAITTIAHDDPSTKPSGIPRVVTRSLASRRQDAVDEIHLLADNIDGGHPLFDLTVAIVRKRAELVVLEMEYYDAVERLARQQRTTVIDMSRGPQ